MNKVLLILIPILSLVLPAQAGPLFDDYLNYVRPGSGTGPAGAQITVTTGQPIGQSFSVPANTGEIYRIGIRPVYDSWNPGERVTMTLFDSPAREHKLGEYAIDEATGHVQPAVKGNGSEFQQTGDRVLYFQFRVPVRGRTQFYFEIAATGGDGKVAFQAFNNKAYADGQISPAAEQLKDLSFECHIKPVVDREANLRAYFTQRLDLTRPELKAVKAAVESRNWEKAIAETVRHFDSRQELWSEWKELVDNQRKQQRDTALADLILKGSLQHAETGQPVPWRKESFWANEYGAKRVTHPVEPDLFGWHLERKVLGPAYLMTGKAEYARKAIDLRMQFILDNPSPKISGVPWYFELWNDRTAAARAPGYGTWVYAQLRDYKGWTNDEKVVLFSFWEDNARWDYESTSGANWGVEAARACYEFGVKFPEWKMSPLYVQWGTTRLADIVLADVRGDGTSVEAAIKYHAMVARRLKGMLQDQYEGRIKLDPQLLPRLTKTVEAMYEHMMYSLMPNNRVVMGGDSWYEDYSEELPLVAKMVGRPDFLWAATQGRQGQPPKEVSKVFPEGGYFIMRSDFGGAGKPYADARQLFVHNGEWFGSHAHWDLLAVNLYAFGRPLIIDPGQYEYTPPPGIDPYWTSRLHSMLVLDGRDVKRAAGPNIWMSNSGIDWLDGKHFGYNDTGDVDYVRRRIAFVKPDYFLIDDSAKTSREGNWTQVWNVADPQANMNPQPVAISTTFGEGGNVSIINLGTDKLTVETALGITAAGKELPNTKIFRLTQKTSKPHFQTLIRPFKTTATGASRAMSWSRVLPDQKEQEMAYSVLVSPPSSRDRTFFGESGKLATYGYGMQVDADFAVIRYPQDALTMPLKQIRSFSWVRGKMLVTDDQTLARANNPVLGLGVEYKGDVLHVEAKEAEPSLAIWARGVQRVVLNGQPIAQPAIKNGMFYPFVALPPTLVADEREGVFEKITKTDEWAERDDPHAWNHGYLCHETDPGRRESGNYILQVPAAGRYRVEVFLPKITTTPSDHVEYVIPVPGQMAAIKGAIKATRQEGNQAIIGVNQQAMAGWVTLGDFDVPAGELKILSRNVTDTDGIYFIADAIRLVKQ